MVMATIAILTATVIMDTQIDTPIVTGTIIIDIGNKARGLADGHNSSPSAKP